MTSYLALLTQWSYLGLFSVLFIAGLGVPLPEDIPLLAAGWLCYRGQANFELMVLTGLIGVMAGDSLLFSMGRRYGDHIMDHKWLRRIAKPWLLDKARQKFTKHGAKIIFAARFMPGLRSVIFLTAGTFRVPFWKFFTIDGFAALISVPLWIWVGRRFSYRIEDVLKAARLGTAGVVGLIVLLVGAWVAYEYYHNLKKRNGIPTTGEGAGEIHSAPLVPPSVAAGSHTRADEASPAMPLTKPAVTKS